MTEYELNQLIILAAEKSGDIMEFWVSVSFSVVVASFFISRQVSAIIFRIMGFLYLLSSMFMASIYVGSGLRANFYYQRLLAMGAEAGHFDDPVNTAAVTMAAVLFFGGTGATLYYMRYCAIKSAGIENQPGSSSHD